MGAVIKGASGIVKTIAGGVTDALGSGPTNTASIDQVAGRALTREEQQAKFLEGLQSQNSAYAQQLQNQALGKGPSLAQAQLQQAQQANLAQQLAAARSTRGVNPALLARQQQMAIGKSGQQLAAQSSVARLQEQQQN